MTFSEILSDAAGNVEGAMAVGLVGVDGIGVETIVTNGYEINTEETEVELAGLVSSVNRSAKALSSGAIKDLIVEGEERSYLITLLDKNYFLAVMLGPQANLGRARFEVKRVAQRLREHI